MLLVVPGLLGQIAQALRCADMQTTDAAHRYAELDQPALLQALDFVAGRVPVIHRLARRESQKFSTEKKVSGTLSCRDEERHGRGPIQNWTFCVRVTRSAQIAGRAESAFSVAWIPGFATFESRKRCLPRH